MIPALEARGYFENAALTRPANQNTTIAAIKTIKGTITTVFARSGLPTIGREG
jgi:hypothetical protein